MNQIAGYRVCYENCVVPSYQVRTDCKSVLESNLPFYEPGSATVCACYATSVEKGICCYEYIANIIMLQGILYKHYGNSSLRRAHSNISKLNFLHGHMASYTFHIFIKIVVYCYLKPQGD